MASRYRGKIESENSADWRNHRGRKTHTKNILDGCLPQRLSYRGHSCTSIEVSKTLLPIDGSNGVDRISARIPVIEDLCDPEVFFSQMNDTETSSLQGSVRLPAGVKVHCRLEKSSSSLIIEFNPSRLLDPFGTQLCPASAVTKTVQIVLEHLINLGGMVPIFAMSEDRAEFLDEWYEGWEAEIGIVRLDIARDFSLPPELMNLDWYKDVKPKNSKATVLWRNDETTETVAGQVGKKTGVTKLYDKHVQSVRSRVMNPAPLGTFRFEQELLRKQLDTCHIHALDQVTDENIDGALRRYWEKSRLDTVVVPPDGWIDFLTSDIASIDLQCRSISYFLARDCGKSLNLTNAQIKEVKQYAQAQGMNTRKAAYKQSPLKYRLDFDSGHLVQIKNGIETELIPSPSLSKVSMTSAA